MSFENEEQLNSDVSTEVSSEPQSAAQEENSGAEEQVSKAPQQQQSEESKPFHEHPRFKELVEQKNQFAQRSQQYERELSELRSRMDTMSKPQTKQEEDALLARLKGIDPEFGSRFEQLQQKLSKFEDIERRIQTYESQQTETQAKGQLSQLCEQHKVPDNLRARYEREVRAIAASNPRLTLNDLPQVFKQVHDDYSQWIDSIKRSERESYVSAKRADSNAPTQPKGKPANPAKKADASRDPSQARAQMVQEILDEVRLVKGDKDF